MIKHVSILAFVLLLVLSLGSAAFAAGHSPRSAEEQVAVETAETGSSVTRNDGSRTFESFFNGLEGTCAFVTVRVKYFPETGRGRTETLNYRVCDGLIVETSESSPTDISIPDGIEDAAQDVARNAQKYGFATGNYQGFKIEGRAVRSQSKCDVEIKIFRDRKLYGVKTIDGCR